MTHKPDQDVGTSKLIEILRSKSIRTRSPDNSCLRDVECASLADGRLEGAERDRLMKHLAYCPDCLERLTAVVVLAREDVESVPPELLAAALARTKGVASARAWSNISWQPALAASLCVLLLSGVLISTHNETPLAIEPSLIPPDGVAETPEVRNVGPVTGQFTILEPLDGASVGPDKLHLHWTSIDQGMFYEVQILSDVGDVVWQTRTENNDLQVPVELGLQHEENYFVLVRAYLHEGKVIRSRLHAIRIDEED